MIKVYFLKNQKILAEIKDLEIFQGNEEEFRGVRGREVRDTG